MRNRWLSFQAKVDAIWHKICHPKHDVRWRINVDKSCPGDITCETCEHIFWCRGLEKKKIGNDEIGTLLPK